MIEESNKQKNFRLSYAELYLFTINLVSCMRRDLEYLEDYGVTEAKITALNAQNEVLNALPSDEILKSDYSYAVDERNHKRAVVEKTTKSIGLRAKEAYRNNLSREKALNIQYLVQLNDGELLNAALIVHSNAVKFLNDLMPEGITQAYLDTYKINIDNFKLSIQTAKEKQQLRNEGTQNRTEAANLLYSQVSKYCDYGKAAFEDTNPSRYSDYVIYTPSAGGLKPPTGLKYLIEHNTAVWDAVENATSYELQYSPNGSDWSEAYGGADNMVYYFPPVEGWAYFRCRARNSNGFGEYSQVLKTGYYQILPPPSNIIAKIAENTDNGLLLTWDTVPSAANYKIYTSIVPIGEPANTYAFLDKTTATKFTAELVRGKRHFFQLVAENTAQSSMNSSAVHLDVSNSIAN